MAIDLISQGYRQSSTDNAGLPEDYSLRLRWSAASISAMLRVPLLMGVAFADPAKGNRYWKASSIEFRHGVGDVQDASAVAIDRPDQ